MTASKSLSRRTKAVPKAVATVLPDPCQSCLQQAKICCEQARDAARLKRFRAAFGLFATASTLCRHVFAGKETDEPTKRLATETLRQIDLEMATYAEFARTSERH